MIAVFFYRSFMQWIPFVWLEGRVRWCYLMGACVERWVVEWLVSSTDCILGGKEDDMSRTKTCYRIPWTPRSRSSVHICSLAQTQGKMSHAISKLLETAFILVLWPQTHLLSRPALHSWLCPHACQHRRRLSGCPHPPRWPFQHCRLCPLHRSCASLLPLWQGALGPHWPPLACHSLWHHHPPASLLHLGRPGVHLLL